MATRVGEMLVLCVLLVLSGAAKAQNSPDCTSSVVTLAPCLNFVSGEATFPSSSCCSALKPVIADTPVCLCLLLGYGGDTSTTIPSSFNQTLAKELPGLCDLSANEERCPALVAGTENPTTPAAAGGPTPPPTTGIEGPSPTPSSAVTLLSSVAVIFSCTAVTFFALVL